MHADNTTCRSRHIHDVTVGLGSTERIKGGPHTDVVGVVTMWPSEGYQYHFALLGGPELLNDFAEQGKRWIHVHRPPLPVL